MLKQRSPAQRARSLRARRKRLVRKGGFSIKQVHNLDMAIARAEMQAEKRR